MSYCQTPERRRRNVTTPSPRMNRPNNMPRAFTVQGYSIAPNPCFGPSRCSVNPHFGVPANPSPHYNTCFVSASSLRKAYPQMSHPRNYNCLKMNRPNNMHGAFTVQGYSIAPNPCFGPSRCSVNPHFGVPANPSPHYNTCFVSASSLRKAYPQMSHPRNNGFK
ncbi:unnamed protein product [Pieris macdunnoughi]|uniref:Uncharacterized protein n=1 Tax=Pieris macdunnoughi TaxID=345717 RepID=A0A821QWD4_9NEOP|nr:unnamed protein product [Pieris macdunnoughi]